MAGKHTLEASFGLVLAISKQRAFTDPAQCESIKMGGPECAPHYPVIVNLYFKNNNCTTEKNEKAK